MKKEINGSETTYLISLFCMPVITFIGVALLLNVIVQVSDTLIVTKYDISNVFFKEIALFMICWILLFISYIFHKIGFKVGQIGVVTITMGLLIFAIYNALSTVTSIANIVNPIVLGSAALYGLLKPLPEVTIKKRKERVKNTLEKYTKVEKKKSNKSNKSKSNKK